MNHSSPHEASEDNLNHHYSSADENLAELRSLLLGFEQSELEKLHERLNSLNINVEDISRLLPEAIVVRSMQDKQLSEAIVPTIEEAIQTSVKKDHLVLSEAIFPVIGPATRKAIATTLEATIQSLNQSIEHSFSPQGFLWRLEALQTGKSFAEVVLLRTLIYQVEQVFLIHKKTGLLLQHLVGEAATVRDIDLVAGMLTAIQDFVQDSFNVQRSDALEALQFGELTIWIEQGPHAVLAGVIRGHPPKELRSVFKNSIEKIHLKYRESLRSFNGDASPFATSKPYLEDCLLVQYQSKQKKFSVFLGAFWGAILLTLSSWAFLTIQDHWRWTTYVERLQSQPGIVVINAKKGWKKYFISGLRDSLSADPNSLLAEVNLNPDAVISKWELYLSLDPEFTLKRAIQLIKPPNTVSLRVDENRILHITGSAPQHWIREARKLAPFTPGITQMQETLVPTEQKQLEFSKKQIENEVLFFRQGQYQLMPGQEQTVQKLIKDISTLIASAQSLGQKTQIEIRGHADTGGTEQINMALSKARAEAIRSTLVAKGFNKNQFSIVSLGTKQPIHKELKQGNQASDRSVSFKVIVTSASSGGTMHP